MIPDCTIQKKQIKNVINTISSDTPFTMNELSHDVKFSSNVASVKCSVVSTSKLIMLSSSLTKSFV